MGRTSQFLAIFGRTRREVYCIRKMSCDHFDLENLKKQLIKRVQKNACPDLKFSLLKCFLNSLEGMKGERARVTTLNENAIFFKQKGKCIH